jgi:ATP-binding cassette subfamily C (CFTR/MRP) protein 1
MIETSSGSIKVDSIDLSTIPRDLIRSRILAVPQDPFLFTGTTRYNADPEELQSDQAIITALRKVELWDVVQEKGGLDFEIEADSLSHGQQQLLCLARVLLRPGNIVVLDESTSR